MNALPEGISRAPRRSDYYPIVRGMRPFLSDEEVDLRSSLLLLRDRALATKPRCCEYAWRLLDTVERIASEHAMNPRVDIKGLREMRRICLNVVASASSFDTLYRPADTPEAA